MTRLSPISEQIWDMKYRLKSGEGPVDATIAETWDRVARALAAPEQDPKAWEPRFRDALDEFRFLPAGRILAGAGTERRVTLFNCFVMGTIGDDLGSIFDHLREAALTMQQGGGIGYDFSTLRPKGAPVHGVGADASGPGSFMDVWDAMCRTIMSAGSRRGAMMGVLRCDHPDIEAFIEAKSDPSRLRMFNVSVLVTDAFVNAIKADALWPLVFAGTTYRTVRARTLWDKIMRATYDYAEPGVIFIDRINAENTLGYCETIAATNPCGEQPLPPYGACLLGSINLARLVRHPFTDKAAIDRAELETLVETAVRMMDNVIDISGYPLEAQAHEARAKRRIGLGVTGLADALIQTRTRYGSPASLALIDQWMGWISETAYVVSADLAREKGAFPLFDAQAVLRAPMVSRLADRTGGRLAEAIGAHGLRNALLTSIAPTGTISLFADNVSSGIEPVFNFTYKRAVLMPDGTREEQTVSDFAYRQYQDHFGPTADLPDYFVTAQTLTPADHLAVQAAAQIHVDSSISKTINCPPDISFEDFSSVYLSAYDQGCKGCTTFRPNDVTGSVLIAEDDAPDTSMDQSADQSTDQSEKPRLQTIERPGAGENPAVASEDGVVYMTQPLARPETLPGMTYKVRWPESDHALYITLNDILQDGRRRPFEIFINSKNMEHYAWTVALTRMISAVFRRGGDVTFVVEELKAVFDPRGGQWIKGRYVPSLLAAIGGVIEQHMIETGFLTESASEPGRLLAPATPGTVATAATGDTSPDGSAASGGAPSLPRGRACPRCGMPTFYKTEGCDTCFSCGHSKCA
ncbi:MAG: adenosylcobalamin-dependent ribonucleoside-diphosphate reductase [Pseudomonadota bacterium]